MEKILVHSYKGGTGKTTVALNAASLLARDSKILQNHRQKAPFI
jgi:MinD-like ATPase involved in chromosome partitioning or flagellar assembly